MLGANKMLTQNITKSLGWAQAGGTAMLGRTKLATAVALVTITAIPLAGLFTPQVLADGPHLATPSIIPSSRVVPVPARQVAPSITPSSRVVPAPARQVALSITSSSRVVPAPARQVAPSITPSSRVVPAPVHQVAPSITPSPAIRATTEMATLQLAQAQDDCRDAVNNPLIHIDWCIIFGLPSTGCLLEAEETADKACEVSLKLGEVGRVVQATIMAACEEGGGQLATYATQTEFAAPAGAASAVFLCGLLITQDIRYAAEAAFLSGCEKAGAVLGEHLRGHLYKLADDIAVESVARSFDLGANAALGAAAAANGCALLLGYDRDEARSFAIQAACEEIGAEAGEFFGGPVAAIALAGAAGGACAFVRGTDEAVSSMSTKASIPFLRLADDGRPIRDGDRIRLANSDEQYLISGEYRRHLVAPRFIGLSGSSSALHVVATHVLDSYPLSTLVYVPSRAMREAEALGIYVYSVKTLAISGAHVHHVAVDPDDPDRGIVHRLEFSDPDDPDQGINQLLETWTNSDLNWDGVRPISEEEFEAYTAGEPLGTDRLDAVRAQQGS